MSNAKNVFLRQNLLTQRFTILEAAADCHELMIPLNIRDRLSKLLPSIRTIGPVMQHADTDQDSHAFMAYGIAH